MAVDVFLHSGVAGFGCVWHIPHPSLSGWLLLAVLLVGLPSMH